MRSNATIKVIAIVLIAFCTFFNTLWCSFAYDDRFAILNNIDVRADESSIEAVFLHDFWGNNITSSASHKSYRPITTLTFRLNYYFGQYQPMGYHFVNIVLHAITSGLVLLCARIVLSSTNKYGSFCAALVFAVHPVHCDSVASVVGRADILCTLMCLCAFISYEQAIRDGPTQWFLYSLSLLLVVIGIELCHILRYFMIFDLSYIAIIHSNIVQGVRSNHVRDFGCV